MSGFHSVFWWLPGASSNILMDAPLHPKLGYAINFYLGFPWGINQNHPGLEKPQQIAGAGFLRCIHSFLQLSLPALWQLSIFWVRIQDSHQEDWNFRCHWDRECHLMWQGWRAGVPSLQKSSLLTFIALNFLFTQVLWSWVSVPGQFFWV